MLGHAHTLYAIVVLVVLCRGKEYGIPVEMGDTHKVKEITPGRAGRGSSCVGISKTDGSDEVFERFTVR